MSAARDIMAKSGLEDFMFARVAETQTRPFVTGGSSWTIGLPELKEGQQFPPRHFSDKDDFKRMAAIVSSVAPSGPGAVIAQLDNDRNLCAKPRFNLQLCRSERLAHQESDCTPAFAEVMKCRIKLTRAVDKLCRKEFVDFQSCRESKGAAAPECFAKKLAWDQCTEEF